MYASFWNAEEIVELLIKAGANLNVQYKAGDTVLMLASLWEYEKIVKLLIKSGADLDLKNNKGKTALDLAKNDEIKEILESAIKSKKRKRETEDKDFKVNKQLKEDK